MSSFASVLQSGSVRLLSGDKEFVVHRQLLQHNLCDLHLSSRDRYVEFDRDDETVAYLLEYLYTGDYTPTSPVREQPPRYTPCYDGAPPQPEQKSDPQPEQEPHPMVIAARTSGLGIWGRPAAVHTTFYDEVPPPPEPQPQSSCVTSDYPHPASVKATANTAAGQAASDQPVAGGSTIAAGSTIAGGNAIASTFRTHAKVYLLAERYGFATLRDFSLQKLRAALKTSELEPSANHTGHAVLLIRNVYELPRPDGRAETVQKLRDIVVAHAVGRLQELQTDEEFAAYIKEGGDFVADLLSALTTSRLALR